MHLKKYPNEGFTLIELMMAVTMWAIVMTAIYSIYYAQIASKPGQRLILETQQNIRAAVFLMKKEIMLAGFDPTKTWGMDQEDNDGDFDIDERDEMENDRNRDGWDNDPCFDKGSGPDALRATSSVIDETFGIKIAGHHIIRFNMDLTGDRDVCDRNEEISYGFSRKYDRDDNGIVDQKIGGTAPLGRGSGRGHLQPFVNHIQALAFGYAYDFDDHAPLSQSDGRLDVSRNNHIIWVYDHDRDGLLDRILDTNDDGEIDEKDHPGGVDLPIHIPISRIRAIRIWILARSVLPIRGHMDKKTYVVGGNHIKTHDHYIRFMYESIINCHNL